MKTNQEMVVNIGDNHTITIGHLTKMGKLNDVLLIGNSYRRNKGLKEKRLDEWLSRIETWEFIQEVEEKYGDKVKTEILGFEKFIRSNGQLEYSKFIKQFTTIKSQRGGKPENRGVWANLQIMLDLAIYLSDIGGDNYIFLNKAIDSLPDRKGKNNSGIHIQIAKLFREKLDLVDTQGYNIKEAVSEIQRLRANWEDKLVSMIEMELITSYEQLKVIVKKLK
ncbi:MAG: DNA-binding protein [Gammaproteobacteria bacterium]|nr:MAG: DNA-binding protein [Gammaproteobacteria bacterium]RKZ74815.1 MAG: DNA-binding protein [Gammaproteobacteria bacterium]